MSLPSLPAPDEEIVHLHRQGQQLGPMSRREIHRRVRVGEADPDDHFWLPGMDAWETIGSRPELFRDLEEPEAGDPPPGAGAGTVMIPRSALGDLGAAEDSEETGGARGGEAAGNAATMLIPTVLGDEEADDADRIGAQTVRFGPDSEMAAELERVRAAGPEAVAATTAVEEAETARTGGEPGDSEPDAEDERLDAVFGELVEESWQILDERQFAERIDEVFLGAVITGALDAGWSLIDLESDGTHHHLRFENLGDHTRLVVRLRHLAGDLATARVLGQKASVVIGYGEKAPNAKEIVAEIRDELQGGFLRNPEPGTISVDGDLTSGYVYARIDLYLSIDRYVAEDYTVDHETLTEHVRATVHALRKVLRGRFFS